MVLLQGIVEVDESTMTGDTIPVTKAPIDLQRDYKDDASIRIAQQNHVLYSGTRILHLESEKGTSAYAVVYRTGFRTARGKLIRASVFSRKSVLPYERDAFRVAVVMFLLCMWHFGHVVAAMLLPGWRRCSFVLLGPSCCECSRPVRTISSHSPFKSDPVSAFHTAIGSHCRPTCAHGRK